MSKNTLPSALPSSKPADDLDELEAQAHEHAAASHSLFAQVLRARRHATPGASAPKLLTRKGYVARYGSADGWSALEAAADRDEVVEHRLGRAKAFLEADVMKIAATREPRKASRPKPANADASPRAAYLALVGSGGRS